MADLSIERSISGLVAGCDEAGRGSWAGPLVAAAVILPKDVILPGVTDSKRINKKRHRELADKILEKALYVGIGVASSAFVDTHGVGYANRYALEQAVKNLPVVPDFVLVDGGPQQKLDIDMPQEELVKGDQKSLSVAAASILAKSVHDALMCQYAKEYPMYHWEENAGYGTMDHKSTMQQYGLSPYHRRSVKPVKEIEERLAGNRHKISQAKGLEAQTKMVKVGGWIYYLSEKAMLLEKHTCGKWIYFFDKKDFASTMAICEKAVAEQVCWESKCRDMDISDEDRGVACFYLNGNDMAGHHRVIQFMLDNNLIPKTRTGRLYNMSFKFDDQTHAGEYGADFEGKIKLNQFVNLDTGEWIT